MTAINDHAPPATTEPYRRDSAHSAGRWQVNTAESRATVHVGLPFGRSINARFNEIAGLVDLAEPGAEAVALLIAANSLAVDPPSRRHNWLGPHVLSADVFPHIALVLDEIVCLDEHWSATGRLHVTRHVLAVDATIRLDLPTQRCTIVFAVDRDVTAPLRGQQTDVAPRRAWHRLDVTLALSISPRVRDVRR